MTTPLTFQVSANLAKLQIIDDIRHGIVPATVTSYSELHDFVDANFYGFGFDSRFFTDAMIDSHHDGHDSRPYERHISVTNAMQDHINGWIEQGRHRRYLTSSHGK